MTTTLTPLGRTPIPAETLAEPTYTLAEQGGFKDATITANFTDAANLRLAAVNISERYLGDVRSAIGQTISVAGKQSALDSVLHGRLYTTTSWESWSDSKLPTITDSIDCAATTSGTRVWTWQDGTKYKAGAYNGCVLDLPEAQAVTVAFTYAWSNMANPQIDVYNATDGTTSYTAASGTVSITTSPTLAIRILAKSTALVTPTGDATLTISNMSVTHTAGATFAAVLGDICDLGGALVPLREIDPSITHTFTELSFPADTSILAMLSTVLAHGDWYARFEPRIADGVTVPCLCVGARPTDPLYTLTDDGESVIADIAALSCDPLASVVRCFYTNSYGVRLFVDVADDDDSHYLVANGVTKMVSIETGQTTSAAAAAIGTRYLVDAGRDQYQGTLTLSGSPGGMDACDYLPGELVTLTTNTHGTIVVRITEGQYMGAHMATLTLDSSPNLADRLANIIERPRVGITRRSRYALRKSRR